MTAEPDPSPRANKPCKRCGGLKRKRPEYAYCGYCAGKIEREMRGTGYLQILPPEPGSLPSADNEERQNWMWAAKRHQNDRKESS
jgi:hypothetical protein